MPRWPIEDIPDPDSVYHRVLKALFDDKTSEYVPPAAIRNTGTVNGKSGMSTNWAKYATPADTLIGSTVGDPKDFDVIALCVGDIRRVPAQIVEHTPSKKNRSHTSVWGPKDGPSNTQIRLRFSRIAKRVYFGSD